MTEQRPKRPYHEWVRDIIDRICESRGINRGELAKELGVNVNTLSSVALKGEVGLPFLEKLARMAGVSPEDLVDIELGWFEKRAQRRTDPAYERVVSVLRALLLDMMDVETWLKKRGLWDEYRRSRPRRHLVKVMRGHLKNR